MLFFFNTFWSILGPLNLHTNFRIILLILQKKPAVILFALNPQINLGHIATLTALSLLNKELGMSFHLFRSSLISLSNVL